MSQIATPENAVRISDLQEAVSSEPTLTTFAVRSDGSASKVELQSLISDGIVTNRRRQNDYIKLQYSGTFQRIGSNTYQNILSLFSPDIYVNGELGGPGVTVTDGLIKFTNTETSLFLISFFARSPNFVYLNIGMGMGRSYGDIEGERGLFSHGTFSVSDSYSGGGNSLISSTLFGILPESDTLFWDGWGLFMGLFNANRTYSNFEMDIVRVYL